MKAIETNYAGCRFRSRLEARWAVFFDAAGIPWEYEPQGFELPTCGDAHVEAAECSHPTVRYLPDFHLPECGTWIEVKGDIRRLDTDLMDIAAGTLPRSNPRPGCEQGPTLLILGNIPRPMESGDWGWIGYGRDSGTARHGFGSYGKNRRPWFLDCTDTEPATWLTATHHPWEFGDPEPYVAARSARFEHGESGWPAT